MDLYPDFSKSTSASGSHDSCGSTVSSYSYNFSCFFLFTELFWLSRLFSSFSVILCPCILLCSYRISSVFLSCSSCVQFLSLSLVFCAFAGFIPYPCLSCVLSILLLYDCLSFRDPYVLLLFWWCLASVFLLWTFFVFSVVLLGFTLFYMCLYCIPFMFFF